MVDADDYWSEGAALCSKCRMPRNYHDSPGERSVAQSGAIVCTGFESFEDFEGPPLGDDCQQLASDIVSSFVDHNAMLGNAKLDAELCDDLREEIANAIESVRSPELHRKVESLEAALTEIRDMLPIEQDNYSRRVFRIACGALEPGR